MHRFRLRCSIARLRDRLVHRAPDVPFGSPDPVSGRPQAEGPEWETFEDGMGGVKASAPDLAIFAQMLLNGGAYGGDARAESCRGRGDDPEPDSWYRDRLLWCLEGGGELRLRLGCRQRRALGVLPRLAPTYRHVVTSRCGGANIFFDPANDIVGVVLEIASVLSPDFEPLLGIFDRFENVIYSAHRGLIADGRGARVLRRAL